jgi:hypothetical protein
VENVTDLAWRETWCGRVWRTIAVRLVERRGDELLLWHPENTPAFVPYAQDRLLRIPGDEDWTLTPAPAAISSVGIVRLGARHSTWLNWRGSVFDGWYVNFERDHDLHDGILDLVDEKLDLVIRPDGRLRVKDFDELLAAARTGYLRPGEVLDEALRVLRDPPWPTGLEDFRADPAWPTPQLPEGWDVV